MNLNFFRVILSLLAFAISSQEVYSQVIVPATLADQVRGAKAGFTAITPEQAAATRSQFEWALYNLDMSLFASGEQNRAAWWSYLNWDGVKEQLAKPTPDVAVLEELMRQLRKNTPGLEVSTFTAVRDALKAYLYILEATADKDMAAAYQERIEQLAKELETYDQQPTVDNLLPIAASVGWFEKRRQIPHVVAAIRNRFTRDNIQVFVSERLLSRNINRCINESSNVSDCILGTAIRGMATMNGQSRLRMVPCANQARLDILLEGCITSNTVGYNRSVQVSSTGNTSVNAHKTLFMNVDSIVGLPAEAHCETHTNINNITSSKLPRIITRIAWKKAGQQMPQAEAIASEKATERVESQMDEQAGPMLQRQNQELQEMKLPLIRTASMPQRTWLSSTNHELVLHAIRWGIGQLSTPDSPPPTITPWDLTVQVHETTIVNYGETYLGNFTLTDENLAKMMKERTGEVPEELQLSEDKDPWSITFADSVPVRAKFENNTVKVVIRGKRFTRGDVKINDQMEISAEYTVELTPTGTKFIRKGDVVVDYVGRTGPQGAQQVAFKTFLRRKFDAMFKKELENEGLELTGRAARLGDQLQTMHAVFNNHWATIGLNSVPKTVKKAKAKPVSKEFVDPNDRVPMPVEAASVVPDANITATPLETATNDVK